MRPSDPDAETSHVRKRPALMIYDYHVPSDRVGLIDLSGQEFLEPFFVQSVGTLAQGAPAPLEVAGDRIAVKAVADAISESSPIPCGGQIYHTGRCGSTLLANALSALDSLLVLKEPPFAQQISADLLVYATVDPQELRHRAIDICDHLVPSTRGQSSYLLKFTSWNALCAEHWQQILHRSPTTFLWRPARDVLESVARNPSGWIVGEESTISPEQLTGRWTKTSDPRIPYPLTGALEVWCSVAEAGLRLAAEGALVLEYDTIAADFPAAFGQVVDHLAVLVDPPDLTRALAEVGRYSKDPSRPWSATRQRTDMLDQEVIRIVERRTADLEEALRDVSRRNGR
jgi:hypothetical protein